MLKYQIPIKPNPGTYILTLPDILQSSPWSLISRPPHPPTGQDLRLQFNNRKLSRQRKRSKCKANHELMIEVWGKKEQEQAWISSW
jgi:hypothetical protein